MTLAKYPVSGGGSGDISGPGVAVTDNGIVLWDGTGGTTIKDGGVGSANQILKTNGTAPSFGLLVNANVDNSAAIAYSKLALTGSVVNADVNASAAIAYSKLATLASGNILVGSAGGVATSVAMSGDITISNAGVTAIGTGVIVNADVNASAAIAYSKLSLGNSIVNSDISSGANIALSKLNSLTSNRAVETNGAGNLSASAVTSTQLGYLSGVTSAIQTQLNNRLLLSGGTLTGALTVGGSLTFNTGGSAADYRIWRSGSNFLLQYNSSAAFQIQDSSGDSALLAGPTGYVNIGSSSNTTSPHRITTGGVSGLPVVYVENAGEFESTIGWKIIGNNTVSFLGASSTESLVVYNSSKTIKHLSISSAGNATFSGGAVTLGPSSVNNYDNQCHIINGNIAAGGTGTGAFTRGMAVGSNWGISGATGPTRTTSTTGACIYFSPRVNNTDATIQFVTNLVTTGTETNVGFATAAGAWTLGPTAGAAVQHNLYSSNASTSSNVGVIGLRSTGSASGQIFLQCNINSTSPNGGIQRNGTTTGVQFFTGSDIRIKENITDAPSVLDRLLAVKVREYTIKGDTGRNLGVIAQELIDVFPEKVNKTDDGAGEELPDGVQPWTVGEAWQYELIKALQELAAKVEALEAAS